MTLLLALLLPASAGTPLLELGETFELGDRGNWARIIDREGGGYWLLTAGAGDYRAQELDEDYAIVSTAYRGLTGRSNLVDHAFAACPDGGFVHVGSGSLDAADDTAWLFRYDAELALVASGTVLKRAAALTTNDAPLACNDDLALTAFQPADLGIGPLFVFDDAAGIAATLSFDAEPPIGGSSMLFEPDGTLAWVRAFSLSDSVQIERYTVPSDLGAAETLEHLGTHEVFLELRLGQAIVAYWPQATVRVGDHYIVAHLGHGKGEEWITDTGNLWLQVFDQDWNWVEGLRVTDFGGGNGASQTYLHWREGAQVLQVLYSVDVQPTLTEVRLDLEALGADPGGSGDGGSEDGGSGDGGATDGGGEDGGAADGGAQDGGAEDGGSGGGTDGGGAADGGAADGGAAADGDPPDSAKGCSQLGLGASWLLAVLAFPLARRRR